MLETATRLFAQRGYEGTSIELVLRECGISRGALYHHFSSKDALFEAVFEALEREIVQRLLARAPAGKDPVQGLAAGCEAWIDMAHEPDIRQIAFIDAPSVLGWEKWREIEARHGFGLLKAALAAANAHGAIPEPFVDTYSHVLLAALNEVGMMIARAPDPAAAARTGKAAVRDLLDRLLRRANERK